MATPQRAILTALGEHQWYVHMSRTKGADVGAIKTALANVRADADAQGVNLCLMFGPTLLADLTNDIPEDFQPYPGYKSADGKEAKATQEELLLWVHSDHKDRNWNTQYQFRINGQVRDALTDYSTPASGSFYFAPSDEVLEAALA